MQVLVLVRNPDFIPAHDVVAHYAAFLQGLIWEDYLKGILEPEECLLKGECLGVRCKKPPVLWLMLNRKGAPLMANVRLKTSISLF